MPNTAFENLKQRTQSLNPGAVKAPEKVSAFEALKQRQGTIQNGKVEAEPGFVQSAVRGIASPVLKTLASGAALYESGKGLAKAIIGKDSSKEMIASDKIRDEGVNFGSYLGKATPVGAVKGGINSVGDFGRGVASSIGTGLDVASNIVGGGGAVGTVKAGLKGLVKQGVKTGAKVGLEAGLLSGAGTGLQDPNATVGSVLKDTAVGGISGTLGGGAFGAVTPVVAKGIGAVTGIATKEGRIASTIADRKKDLSVLEDYNSIAKVVQKNKDRGIDIPDIVAKTDLLHKAVDANGVISTKGDGEAISRLQDFIKPQEKVIIDNLVREGKSVKPSVVQAALERAVNTSGLEGAALSKAHREIAADMAGYARRALPNGEIPLATLHSAKIDKYSNINFMTEAEKQKSGKAIAKALKELVEKRTSSINVKSLNEELSKHYAVLNYLEKLDGKRVEGGRLGKHFARILGGMAGSHFGPLGTVIGSELAGGLKGLGMKSTFGAKIGRNLEMSPAMKEGIKLGTMTNVPVKLVGKAENKVPVSTPFSREKVNLPVTGSSKTTNIPVNKGQGNYYGQTMGEIQMGSKPKQIKSNLPVIQLNNLGKRNNIQAATTNASKTSIPKIVSQKAPSVNGLSLSKKAMEANDFLQNLGYTVADLFDKKKQAEVSDILAGNGFDYSKIADELAKKLK